MNFFLLWSTGERQRFGLFTGFASRRRSSSPPKIEANEKTRRGERRGREKGWRERKSSFQNHFSSFESMCLTELLRLGWPLFVFPSIMSLFLFRFAIFWGKESISINSTTTNLREQRKKGKWKKEGERRKKKGGKRRPSSIGSFVFFSPFGTHAFLPIFVGTSSPQH